MKGGAPGAVDKGVDFAQYFCTYAYLYHQKEMLCDRVRMDAYFNAIFQNKHHFLGKVSSADPSEKVLSLYQYLFVIQPELIGTPLGIPGGDPKM